jgi:diguanylate cyclase (GGDEF)-like protein
VQKKSHHPPGANSPVHSPGVEAQSPEGTRRGNHGKIMVVDDHPDALHLLTNLLLEKGHRVFAFPSAHDALATIEQIQPELLLLDIRMPLMDGYTFCQRVRECPKLRDMPVLFLSALNTRDDIVKAFESGGTDYLSKPFHAAELHARVGVHLENVFLRRKNIRIRKRLVTLVSKLRSELERRRTIEARLRTMADTDALTGLYNRRVFMDMLPREVSRATRHHQPLCLLMVDVDHFKRINDTLGHAQGDHCLRKLSAIITRNLRKSDVAARLGGEEFTILLPQTNLGNAKIAAERILQDVRKQTLHCSRQDIKATVSIGVAELHYPAASADELLRQADLAMYRAKEQGRDRVCLCRPSL